MVTDGFQDRHIMQTQLCKIELILVLSHGLVKTINQVGAAQEHIFFKRVTRVDANQAKWLATFVNDFLKLGAYIKKSKHNINTMK